MKPAGTYYERLGVAADATSAEIRRAYLRLARELHPDRNRAPDASTHFAEAAAAYDVLADPKRRAQYDAQLARGGAEPVRTIRLPRSIVDPAELLVVNALDETAHALADSLDKVAARSGLAGRILTAALRGAAETVRERAEAGAAALADRLRGPSSPHQTG